MTVKLYDTLSKLCDKNLEAGCLCAIGNDLDTSENMIAEMSFSGSVLYKETLTFMDDRTAILKAKCAELDR